MGVTVLFFAAELQKVITTWIFSDFWEDWGEFQNGMYVKVEGGKTFSASFCASLIAGSRRVFSVCWLCSTVCLFFTERVLTKTAEGNVQGVNVCFSKSLFTFVWFSFFVTWKLLGLGTTNVKRKTDHPVSLRWSKEFWTFPKRRGFFWLFFDLIVSWFSFFRRAEFKPAFFKLVNTFSQAQIYYLGVAQIE